MDKLTKIILGAAGSVGVVLLLRAGIRPESRRWSGIVMATDYLPLLNGFPSGDDADERTLICEGLERRYPFKVSLLHTDHLALYGLPGSHHSVIIVFEVIKPAEQERILAAAREVRASTGVRPFVIEFFARETGPEPVDQFLRKVRID